MKIFFSYGSTQRPLVRALRAQLPQHLNAWIDEDDLLLGDSIEKTLKQVLQTKIDYVLLLVDDKAAQSPWVAKEVAWAMEREHECGRRLVLPVVVSQTAWENSAFTALRDRKYVSCPSASPSDVRSAAEKIASMLFSLICRDVERQAFGAEFKDERRHGAPGHTVECDTFATAVREVAFRHRDYNPLPLSELTQALRTRGFEGIGEHRVAEMIGHVLKEGLIPGLVFNGACIFVREEHFRWKSEIAAPAKAAIARAAVEQISKGDTIALDAGSTTEAIAKVLCGLFSNRAISNLRIVTNSVPAINLLLETAVTLGLDETNDLFELHVPSGIARPSTLSITDLANVRVGSFGAVLREIGGADVGFVGANGVDPTHGFTAHSARSATRKQQILRNSRKKFIVADSSKFGVHEDVAFASFNETLTLIADASGERAFNRRFSRTGVGWFGMPRARLLVAADASQPAALAA